MAAGRGLKVAVGAAAIAAVVGAGVYALSNRGPSLAPDFSAPDLKGQAVSLASLRGKVVVVNVWTTWCPPCREEMPSMERLHQRLKDKGFVLLAVSQDEGGAAGVKAFVEQMHVTFRVRLDPDGDVGRKYEVWGFPESFLLDRDGRVVERVIGPRDWSSPEQIARIEALLAAPPGGAAAATP